MLLSTSQISHAHSLDKNRPAITISDSTLEYVNVCKLLGVHFHQHLNLDEHVQATCKSCCGTIQNFAGYRLKKHLVESLVLSKLDYCDTVYYPLPEFQLNRLQRVQLVAASFVLNRYVNDVNNIVKIGRLPVRQQRDFHVLKLVHQALYSPSWPTYVPLDTVKHLRSLRSGAATRLIIPTERGTFQDSAAKLFNVLPANIRNCSDFKVYFKEVNAYLV